MLGLELTLLCRMATLPVQHQRWERPESLQPMFIREDSSPAQVVGTVEVSLVPSTRTRYLTLNAPEVIPMHCPHTHAGNSSRVSTSLRGVAQGLAVQCSPSPERCAHACIEQQGTGRRSAHMSATWQLTLIIGDRATGCCC